MAKARKRYQKVLMTIPEFETGDPFAESDLPVDHITENQKKAE